MPIYHTIVTLPRPNGSHYRFICSVFTDRTEAERSQSWMEFVNGKSCYIETSYIRGFR